MNTAQQRTIPSLLSQLMCSGRLLVKCFQPSFPLWSLPALFTNENKTFGPLLGSLRWQKKNSLDVRSTPSVLQRARDEVVVHWGIFHGMVCVVNLDIMEGVMPKPSALSEKKSNSSCQAFVVSELFLLRAVGSSISKKVFRHQKKSSVLPWSFWQSKWGLSLLITAVPQPAWPASQS